MKKTNRKTVILLSAGGTGGHIAPASVLQTYFIAQNTRCAVITDQPHWFKEQKNVFASPYLKRKKSLFKTLITLTKDRLNVFKTHKPQHLVCFGSLYCLPSFLAFLCWRMKGNACTLSLHEQNAILGRAHRLMQFFAKNIFTAFPNTQKISHLAKHKALHSGTPTRRAHPIANNKKKIIFIIGGSQGASVFADQVFMKSWYYIPEDIRKNLKVYHQAPRHFVNSTLHIYHKLGVEACVCPFFKNAPDLLRSSSVVLSRAGGSTLAEILHFKAPSILVPLPQSLDNHQLKNALALSKKNAAILLKQKHLSPQKCSEHILSLLTDTKKIKVLKEALKEFPAKKTCSLIYEKLQ